MSDTATIPNRYSPAGRQVIRLPRWKLCQYFLATNYAPFTAAHAEKVMGVGNLISAQSSINALITLKWARRVDPPSNCKLTKADAEAEWYELTTLGIQRIMDSGHAKGKPRPVPGSVRPLYLRASSFIARPETGGLENVRRVDIDSVSMDGRQKARQAPPLTIATPAGDVVLPAEAMRAVYDSLKAIFE